MVSFYGFCLDLGLICGMIRAVSVSLAITFTLFRSWAGLPVQLFFMLGSKLCPHVSIFGIHNSGSVFFAEHNLFFCVCK